MMWEGYERYDKRNLFFNNFCKMKRWNKQGVCCHLFMDLFIFLTLEFLFQRGKPPIYIV